MVRAMTRRWISSVLSFVLELSDAEAGPVGLDDERADFRANAPP
jgi:hypothetical protein